MAYQVIEHKVSSMRGYKNPIHTGRRTYHSRREVTKRVRWLRSEYGEDDVVNMHSKADPHTEIVYIRVF